jgi:hypothetical protein
MRSVGYWLQFYQILIPTCNLSVYFSYYFVLIILTVSYLLNSLQTLLSAAGGDDDCARRCRGEAERARVWMCGLLDQNLSLINACVNMILSKASVAKRSGSAEA